MELHQKSFSIQKLYSVMTIAFVLISMSCNSVLINDEDNTNDAVSPTLNGAPVEASLNIYQSEDLSNLCAFDDCEKTTITLPDSHRVDLESTDEFTCAFNTDPNATTQFVLHHPKNDINGLDLKFSKEDLFFLAWVSLRYQINPHFLVGVMLQESYGNCAAVSFADAEGCFQITNYYGRLQLQQSYGERVLDWFWNESPNGYYPDSIFIPQLTWFGEQPDDEQFRMTLDPQSPSIFGTDVSSVVNFQFGSIASALYFHWQEYFLYFNYSSTRGTVEELIANDPSEKAKLMAAAYNGGIGRLANSLKNYGESYALGLQDESETYRLRVTDYCAELQASDQTYNVSYNRDEMDYIIDLLSYTYPSDSQIDWSGLKDNLHETFFSNDDSITLLDDIKAVIFYISTYDPDLAPEFADDVAL